MVVLQRAYLLGVFRQWPEGAEGTLTLTRERGSVTKKQRAYWFGCVVPIIAEFTGDDIDSTHDDLKRMFFPKITRRWKNKRTGKWKRRIVRPSITQLNRKQMNDLIEHTRKYFAEHYGLEIPEPDPAWREREEQSAAALRSPREDEAWDTGRPA